MLGHILAVKIGELAQRYSIGDAFAQLAIIPILHPHQNQGAQHLRRGEAAAALIWLFQAGYQIVPHPLDQRRLLIEKITDRLQQRLKPHAQPQQFEIGKAHLSRCRPRHGSTQPAGNRRPQANCSADHPAADDIGRLFGVAANHRSSESHRTPYRQAKLAAQKRWKCRFRRTILPFATETS
jgi:hypothetical protein